MKLQELKQRVYNCWTRLSSFKLAVIQPDNFKPEMRVFGDLRYKSTWEKALCLFWARNIYDACLDSYELITIYFNYNADAWDYEYRHQVFEAFLTLPHGWEMLKTGLEDVFSADFTPEERNDAHGFFKLVQEQSGRRGLHGQPARLIQQVQELTGATTG